MTRLTSLLFVLLNASVALNLYFVWQTFALNSTSLLPTKQPHNSSSSAPASNATFNDIDGTEAIQNDNKYTNQSNDNRDKLLAQAKLWLQEKNLVPLAAFLRSYLKQQPLDMDFLLIEAKMKVETDLLSDAIAHYYDLLRNPMTLAQQDEIEQQIKLLSKSTIEHLTLNYSWDILAMFVEPLLQLEPTSRLYIASLARAYAELYQEGLMENVLASLPFDDPQANKIRTIIQAKQSLTNNKQASSDQLVDTQSSFVQPIPLKQYGDQFVVDGALSGNQVSLLIDTGASVTALSKGYFDSLSNRYKINYLGRFSIGTAGGSIMAPMYRFSELRINHVKVDNLAVVILPMQGIANADGLLGMNFLREFDFKIDQNQKLIFIE
jgi:clan AA aspartic protease (TIGR02281 family)